TFFTPRNVVVIVVPLLSCASLSLPEKSRRVRTPPRLSTRQASRERHPYLPSAEFFRPRNFLGDSTHKKPRNHAGFFHVLAAHISSQNFGQGLFLDQIKR